MCTIYLIIRFEYIRKHLLYNNTMNKNIAMFNTKSVQLERDIKFIKSKSFDTADTNIVLQHRSEQITHDIELLKSKNRYYSNELQKLKDLFEKLSE